MNHEEREHLFIAAGITLAKALPDAWAIYMYGSFARGEERPDSDLDLAVLLAPATALPDKLSLMAEVSRTVGREVDIVNLRKAGLDLIHELLQHGRQLLVRRENDVLAWEAERMSEYANFNPRRQEIISQYLHEPLRT